MTKAVPQTSLKSKVQTFREVLLLPIRSILYPAAEANASVAASTPSVSRELSTREAQESRSIIPQLFTVLCPRAEETGTQFLMWTKPEDAKDTHFPITTGACAGHTFAVLGKDCAHCTQVAAACGINLQREPAPCLRARFAAGLRDL